MDYETLYIQPYILDTFKNCNINICSYSYQLLREKLSQDINSLKNETDKKFFLEDFKSIIKVMNQIEVRKKELDTTGYIKEIMVIENKNVTISVLSEMCIANLQNIKLEDVDLTLDLYQILNIALYENMPILTLNETLLNLIKKNKLNIFTIDIRNKS